MARAHFRRGLIALLVIISLTISAAILALLLHDGSPQGPAVEERQRPLGSVLIRASELMQRARTDNSRDHLRQAERILHQALKNAPGDAAVLAELGYLFLIRHDLGAQAKGAGHGTDLDSAREIFEKALKGNPQDPRALQGLAKYYEFRGDYRSALSMDQRILAKDPHNQYILNHMARCLLMIKQYARAEEVLLKALQRAKNNKDSRALIFTHELLGNAYLRQGKYRLAEKALLWAVNKAEASKVAACPYAALGELYSITGRADKVVDTAVRAAEMEPNASQLQYTAALTCYDEGQYDKALKYIHRAIALGNQPELKDLQQKILSALKPRPPAMEFKTSLDRLDEYDFRHARLHIDRALAAEGRNKYKVVKGFLLLLEKKYAQAEELLRQARASDKNNGGARVGLGHLSIIRKDYARARRLLEPAVLSGDRLFSPSEGRKDERRRYEWLVYKMACQGMGWLLSNQNKHQAALTYYDRILNNDPEDIFALLGKGNSENALGRLDAAERYLKQVLTIDDVNEYAMAELALVNYNRGRYTEAEQLFKKALQHSRSRKLQYTCPYEGLGLVYLRAGKLDQAKTNFREAIRINPDIEYKKFNGLARIMIREGKLEKARELLIKSIQNYPYDDEARKLLSTLPPSKDHSP